MAKGREQGFESTAFASLFGGGGFTVATPEILIRHKSHSQKEPRLDVTMEISRTQGKWRGKLAFHNHGM